MNESDYNLRTTQLREAGSQLASTTGVLQTVYFAAISFSNLKTQLPNSKFWFYYVPIVFWIIALLLSLLVLIPDDPISKYSIPNEQRQKWFDQRNSKWKIAYVLLFVGVLWMSYVMFHYLFILDLTPQTP